MTAYRKRHKDVIWRTEYTLGAEEVGLLPDGDFTLHLHSAFLETYIEGVGCDACRVGDIPVARNNSTPTNPAGLPAHRRYSDNQELVDQINSHGGFVTLNHPTRGIGHYAPLQNFGAMEIFSNFMALADERGGGSRSATMLAHWDKLLETKSSMIWGVAVNDWFGAFTEPRPAEDGWPELTEKNLDRGKIQVLVTAFDIAAYRAAFEAGAFFAVVEDNAVKGAYPIVTTISVSSTSIELTTAAGDETGTWLGNGQVIGSGMTLRIDDLPPGLKYARAVINDLQGRLVFTQPFSLEADQDGGGIGDSSDNCAGIWNTNQQDSDLDGAGDECDNCIDAANGPLVPDAGGNIQLDTDGDSYGNMCDPDFNGNNIVDPFDFSMMRSRIGQSNTADQDLNGNGIIDPFDFSKLKSMLGQPPGPSSIAP